MQRPLLLFFLCGVLLDSSYELQAQQEIAAKFVARSQPYIGGSLPYRLFIPSPYDSLVVYPLVLALHGSGERGSDNLTQLLPNRLATSWADPANQASHPCFVVAPQCPANLDWSYFMGVLTSLVDSLCRRYSVDTNRLIVTGLSMGGYGTWELITLFPDRFASAVPMSAGWDPSDVHRFHNLPVWNSHGAIDNTVPVSQSRDMMSAIERDGRSVIYTHGHGRDYRGLPDSAVTAALRSHDDAFYTEYQFGGHVIWDQAYDTPSLHAWVFDHYRRTPGALHLTGPNGSTSLHGQQLLTWTGGVPADTIEFWWSSNAGASWVPITSGTPNTGTFIWNTLAFPDCGLGKIKAFLRNPKGHCYAIDESGFMRLDNAGDGSPTVRVLAGAEVFSPVSVTSDSILLPIVAADPEGATLTASVDYSLDTGRTYQQSGVATLSSDTAQQNIWVHLSPLPNSTHAMLRVRAFDGSQSGSDLTVLFVKQSARQSGPVPTATVGGSRSIVKVNVVNGTALTGHLYRVTFYDSSGFKWYHVEDKTDDRIVVQRGAPIDGVSEGPLFDGLRLIVTDYMQATVDVQETHWITGTSTQTFAIFSPVITFDTLTIHGIRTPADYRITLADHVVDTSLTAVLGIPQTPMRFSVWNLTENRKVAIGYLDNDGNNALTHQDEIYFLEPDSAKQLRLTWGMTYNSPAYSTPPLAGDQFVFRTFKPIQSGDTYEFTGTVVSVPHSGVSHDFALEQNYPNPFNPTTVITGQWTVTSDVRLVVYDILGRAVATLANGRYQAGRYTFTFDGSRLASGVYFYRLTAGKFVATRSMVLLK